MTEEVLAIEPIKKKKNAVADLWAMVHAVSTAPLTLVNALAESIRIKSLEIVISHFQSMKDVISENNQRNRKQKMEWYKDNLEMEKRMLPFLKHLSSLHQKNSLDLLYRTVAQIQ